MWLMLLKQGINFRHGKPKFIREFVLVKREHLDAVKTREIIRLWDSKDANQNSFEDIIVVSLKRKGQIKLMT